MAEISNKVNEFAPYKLIQCNKNDTPWTDITHLQETNLRDNLHKTAILTNNQSDWRLYRRQRNKCNRINKDNEKKYYDKRLNKPDKVMNNKTQNCDNNDN